MEQRRSECINGNIVKSAALSFHSCLPRTWSSQGARTRSELTAVERRDDTTIRLGRTPWTAPQTLSRHESFRVCLNRWYAHTCRQAHVELANFVHYRGVNISSRVFGICTNPPACCTSANSTPCRAGQSRFSMTTAAWRRRLRGFTLLQSG